MKTNYVYYIIFEIVILISIFLNWVNDKYGFLDVVIIPTILVINLASCIPLAFSLRKQTKSTAAQISENRFPVGILIFIIINLIILIFNINMASSPPAHWDFG